jgi:hypothetical protein
MSKHARQKRHTPPDYLPGPWDDDDETAGCERVIEGNDEVNQTSEDEDDD